MDDEGIKTKMFVAAVLAGARLGQDRSRQKYLSEYHAFLRALVAWQGRKAKVLGTAPFELGDDSDKSPTAVREKKAQRRKARALWIASDHPLKSYLDKHAESVRHFAARVGVFYSTIYRLIEGKTRLPPAELLSKIQKATGGEVTINEMLDWQPHRPAPANFARR